MLHQQECHANDCAAKGRRVEALIHWETWGPPGGEANRVGAENTDSGDVQVEVWEELAARWSFYTLVVS